MTTRVGAHDTRDSRTDVVAAADGNLPARSWDEWRRRRGFQRVLDGCSDALKQIAASSASLAATVASQLRQCGR